VGRLLKSPVRMEKLNAELLSEIHKTGYLGRFKFRGRFQG